MIQNLISSLLLTYLSTTVVTGWLFSTVLKYQIILGLFYGTLIWLFLISVPTLIVQYFWVEFLCPLININKKSYAKFLIPVLIYCFFCIGWGMWNGLPKQRLSSFSNIHTSEIKDIYYLEGYYGNEPLWIAEFNMTPSGLNAYITTITTETNKIVDSEWPNNMKKIFSPEHEFYKDYEFQAVKKVENTNKENKIFYDRKGNILLVYYENFNLN